MSGASRAGRRGMVLLAVSGLLGCPEPPPPPVRYDIAYIEQSPAPAHLRFLSTGGELSDPVFLPDGMRVHTTGHNGLSWSPDGQQLALASRVGDNMDIYTINANGSGLRRVTQDPAWDESPAWSPDGTRILFLTTRHDQSLRDVYVHDLATGAETRLTPTSSYYGSPAWSPDNATVAYWRNVSYTEGDEILTHDLATGAVTVVANPPGPMLVQGLQWAPSAGTLLFYAPGGFSDVYTIGVDGSGLANRTNTTSLSQEPSWYESGQILFANIGISSLQEGIYRMNPNGSGKTLIRAVSAPRSPVYRFAAVDLPDLVVASHSAAIDASDPAAPVYRIECAIRNQGTAASGPALVYVDAVNPDPGMGASDVRLQARLDLPALPSGDTSPTLTATFDVGEIHAKGVTLIRVTADPKVMVTEAFETNNVAEWVWP